MLKFFLTINSLNYKMNSINPNKSQKIEQPRYNEPTILIHEALAKVFKICAIKVKQFKALFS